MQGCGSGSPLGWKAGSGSAFKVKIYKFSRFNIEPRKTVSQWMPGGSKWSPGVSIDQWSQISITLKRSWIRIRIKVENSIRIRVKVEKAESGSALKWCGSATPGHWSDGLTAVLFRRMPAVSAVTGAALSLRQEDGLRAALYRGHALLRGHLVN
jgi:hypothetical protein